MQPTRPFSYILTKQTMNADSPPVLFGAFDRHNYRIFTFDRPLQPGLAAGQGLDRAGELPCRLGQCRAGARQLARPNLLAGVAWAQERFGRRAATQLAVHST